MIVTFTFEEI